LGCSETTTPLSTRSGRSGQNPNYGWKNINKYGRSKAATIYASRNRLTLSRLSPKTTRFKVVFAGTREKRPKLDNQI
jgi:hypothetical protein